MHRNKLLLLPLLAGGMFLISQAQECRPDNANTAVTAKSKKFYCTESLDSSGCNAGRSALKLEIDSSCTTAKSIEVICSARFKMKTRKYTEGTEKVVTVAETVELENGKAEEKVYMTLNSLTDPMMNVKITETLCRVNAADVRSAPAPLLPPEVPEVAPVEAVEAPAELQSILPQPEEKGLVITPQPAPQVQMAQPQPSDAQNGKHLDLEILKEQNRARELEIRALELKIKLKEME